MSNRKAEAELGRFKSVKRYEVRVAEEALPEVEKVGKAHPHALEILGRLARELEIFPPNPEHFSEPEVSFNGVQVSHAVVVSENLVIRLVAHFRLEAICMIVHIEAAKSR